MHKSGQDGKGGPKVVEIYFKSPARNLIPGIVPSTKYTYAHIHLLVIDLFGEKGKKRKKKQSPQPIPSSAHPSLLPPTPVSRVCTNQKRKVKKIKQKKSLMNFQKKI